MQVQRTSRWTIHVWLIGIIFAIVSFFSQPLLCVGSELDELRNNASLMPSRLHSYQFTGTFQAKEDDPKREPVVNSAKFYQSGSSFRVESDAVARPGIKIDPLVRSVVFAYNGSRYQWFMAGRETLSFSSQCRHPNVYWLPNPVVLPYLWLVGPKGNWSDIKERNVWIKKFDAAHYEGEQVENGVTYAVASMLLDKDAVDEHKGVIVRIWFAKDLGYYPLKFVEYKNERPWVTMQVTRFTTLDADGGKLVFPLAITITAVPPNGVDMNWTISDVSIKVNQPIDEALFTLSPSIAKNVIDYDKELKKLVQPHLETNYIPQPSPWRGRLLIISCTALVVLVGCFIYRRMRRRRQ